MTEKNGKIATQGFTFVLVEDFTHVAFSCAVEPLRIANLLSGEELYRWRLASENGKTAASSNGSVTLVDGGLEPVPHNDMLFVLSGISVNRHVTPALLSYIRRERARGTRIGALCSGAYILAKAGLLDGMRAAIHWEFHDAFVEEFPDVRLCRSVFVTDERIITASGGTAAADLMLHMIAQEHGIDLSTAVADQMVYNAVREPTADQKVSLQARYGIRNPHISEAVQIMADHLEEPITPSQIAARIGISTRQLERLFGRYVNCSPKRYLVEMRLHKARNLLVQTERSVTDIAIACGFASASHFTRVYRANLGITPVMQRSRLS